LVQERAGNTLEQCSKSKESPCLYLPSLETPLTTGIGEDVGKKEPLYTAGGNVN
jgi:hypothetical protein